MSIEYKVITNAEWDAATRPAKAPPTSKRRGRRKVVLLREENGTKYYGRSNC